MRLAFKLFDSEGVALVNLLRGGSDALDEMRARARDLGIVLDEALVRDAERARTELDTLSQVISANLTRAALEAAPVIADLSSWLADVAGKAGIAWERLFDAPEETDYKAAGQLLGTGDDVLTQFQLVKHYPSGSVIEVRTITKPVAGTVKVYLGGIEQLSGWSVDTTTGLVTFGTAPTLGVEVTAYFEFDVPVRFDTDHMAVTIESYRLHAWQQIPIVELRT